MDSKLIWKCRRKLHEASRKNKVSLIWVLDHFGIKLNEESNILAKKSAGMSLTGSEPFCSIDKNTDKNFLEKEKAERGNHWQEIITSKDSFGALKMLGPKDIWSTVRFNYIYSSDFSKGIVILERVWWKWGY